MNTTTTLALSELQNPSTAASGRQFVVCGRLVVGDTMFVDTELEGSGIRLVIDDPAITDILLDSVPCLLSGKHLYNDLAELVCELKTAPAGGVVVGRVVSGALVRDGHRHEFYGS